MSTYRPIASSAVFAERYGDRETGQWSPGAVRDVAAFMLDRHPGTHIPDADILRVLRPAAGRPWDPPEEATLQIWVAKANAWYDLPLGDFVVREPDGSGCGPVEARIFLARYEWVPGQ